MSVHGMSVQELMPIYYGKCKKPPRLFPVEALHRWLAYGHGGGHPQANTSFFQRREFCFTLHGDIFVRYQSFKDGMELHAALKDRVPSKIDIGPVYNVDPSRRTAYSGLGSDRIFAPLERELVFDIDISDYDDVRTCCKEGAICKLCWPLMAVAIMVINEGLRDDFGFHNILWVFSGRRGIHCWVCDAEARAMTDSQRSALSSYLNVYKGQEKSGELARALLNIGSSSRLHPSLERASEALEKAWREEYLPKQNLLENDSKWEGILSYIPDDNLKDLIRSKWSKPGMRLLSALPGSESVERWDILVEELNRQASSCKDKRHRSALMRTKLEIIFAHTYPRLDIEVSKKMNHLLKAPFCVHPKTGKVCIPIDPETAWDFDVEAVPTVWQLITELNDSKRLNVNKGEDWQETSLCTAVELFSTFLKGLTDANRAEQAAKTKETITSSTVLW